MKIKSQPTPILLKPSMRKWPRSLTKRMKRATSTMPHRSRADQGTRASSLGPVSGLIPLRRWGRLFRLTQSSCRRIKHSRSLYNRKVKIIWPVHRSKWSSKMLRMKSSGCKNKWERPKRQIGMQIRIRSFDKSQAASSFISLRKVNKISTSL